jgi:hypothetical protein
MSWEELFWARRSLGSCTVCGTLILVKALYTRMKLTLTFLYVVILGTLLGLPSKKAKSNSDSSRLVCKFCFCQLQIKEWHGMCACILELLDLVNIAFFGSWLMCTSRWNKMISLLGHPFLGLSRSSFLTFVPSNAIAITRDSWCIIVI